MPTESIARRLFLKLIGAGAAATYATDCSSHTDSGDPTATSSASGCDFDYIIVGSGAGGGPLAANLARNGLKVLLIEAGVDRGGTPLYQIPLFHPQSTADPLMRWDYFVKHYSDASRQALDTKAVSYTTPSGAKEQRILYPRAGTLGGCTAHNAMITVYPHDSDWDYIAQLTGDSSWSSSNMRTYFERLENCHYVPTGTAGHGFAGWFRTEVPDAVQIFGSVIAGLKNTVSDGGKIIKIGLSAAIATGEIPSTGGFLNLLKTQAESLYDAGTQLFSLLKRDLNADTSSRDGTEGLFSIPLATNRGHRNGPREYLVETASQIPNGLVIWTNTLATRVIFDDQRSSGGKLSAIGVEYMSAPHLYRADPNSSATPAHPPARHTIFLKPGGEVILSAGAFNTPQLLKLSGIGPEAELAALKIQVTLRDGTSAPVLNLAGVGKNLQDRYEVGVVSTVASDIAVDTGCSFDPNANDACMMQWAGGAGTYITNGAIAGIIMKKSTPDRALPDLFIFGVPGYFVGYYPGWELDGRKDARHFSWLILKAYTTNNDEGTNSSTGQPGGGTVTLATSNPWDMPNILFNYFDEGATNSGQDQNDLNAVVAGVTFARQIGSTANTLVDGGFKEQVPGNTDVATYVKNETWGHHASCTCKIGADGDPLAVLDSKFQVRGTSGLRVVDASVFPRIPGFFIVVPIYVISEKATDVILQANVTRKDAGAPARDAGGTSLGSNSEGGVNLYNQEGPLVCPNNAPLTE